ncbi:MAG: translation elongation factor Ts [Candidatus Pacebacteria bacterium]|nr:translation elongation factor Ts [Candidatus Paceibacterota bacterium]MBP9715850.1 translation elongation factor Ts [Candidatus Paceibacterota bacterium]
MSIQITTELIKELRDSTGVSVMQCRKALEEAEGDMEKALLVLKKKSSDIAMKKADREAHEGAITVISNGNKTVIFTLYCETDFVAKNEDFVNLANTLANKALNEGVEAMKESSTELINTVVQKCGEKIELGKVELVEGDVVGSYVHMGKTAVVVSLEGGSTEIARDIAMHIAAMKPAYITREEIDEKASSAVREMFAKEVSESDKPEDIKAKMLEGKISTYFKEQTLLDQSFIKNPDITIATLLSNNKAVIKSVSRESIG